MLFPWLVDHKIIQLILLPCPLIFSPPTLFSILLLPSLSSSHFLSFNLPSLPVLSSPLLYFPLPTLPPSPYSPSLSPTLLRSPPTLLPSPPILPPLLLLSFPPLPLFSFPPSSYSPSLSSYSPSLSSYSPSFSYSPVSSYRCTIVCLSQIQHRTWTPIQYLEILAVVS